MIASDVSLPENELRVENKLYRLFFGKFGNILADFFQTHLFHFFFNNQSFKQFVSW